MGALENAFDKLSLTGRGVIRLFWNPGGCAVVLSQATATTKNWTLSIIQTAAFERDFRQGSSPEEPVAGAAELTGSSAFASLRSPNSENKEEAIKCLVTFLFWEVSARRWASMSAR